MLSICLECLDLEAQIMLSICLECLDLEAQIMLRFFTVNVQPLCVHESVL